MTTLLNRAGLAAKVLDRRDSLLAWLTALRDATQGVPADESDHLREQGIALVDAIDDYLEGKNQLLAPALERIADGDVRLALLEAEHRDEHDLLRGARHRLLDPSVSTAAVPQILEGLADGLVACFAEEDDVVLALGVVSEELLDEA